MATVSTRLGHRVSAKEIIEFCAEKLARYKLPKRICLIEELPLSETVGVSKPILKEIIESGLLLEMN